MSTNRGTQVPPLWLVQAIITTSRGVFRIQELFAEPRKREKLRKFREKMSALEADKKEVLHRLKNDPKFGALEAMNLLLEHNKGDDEIRAGFEESRDQLQAVRRVSQELQDISSQRRWRLAEGRRQVTALIWSSIPIPGWPILISVGHYNGRETSTEAWPPTEKLCGSTVAPCSPLARVSVLGKFCERKATRKARRLSSTQSSTTRRGGCGYSRALPTIRSA